MTWEGYTWLLLKAIGINSCQLISTLQPLQGRFPNTEAEFEQMCMTLRRMGHILEHTPGNLASALKSPPSSAFPTWGQDAQSNSAYLAVQTDPWASGGRDLGHPLAADPHSVADSRHSEEHLLRHLPVLVESFQASRVIRRAIRPQHPRLQGRRPMCGRHNPTTRHTQRMMGKGPAQTRTPLLVLEETSTTRHQSFVAFQRLSWMITSSGTTRSTSLLGGFT